MTTSDQTSQDSWRVYLGPTGFYKFWNDGLAGQLPIFKGKQAWCILLGWPRHLNGAPFSKELKQHIVKRQLALKCLSNVTLCLGAMLVSFFPFPSLLYSIRGSHREDTGDYPAAYGYIPEWVASSLHCPMWALRVWPPCLRVPQQLSDGVLAPPPFNKNASQVLFTFQPSSGTWHSSTALTHLPTTFVRYWYIDRLSGPSGLRALGNWVACFIAAALDSRDQNHGQRSLGVGMMSVCLSSYTKTLQTIFTWLALQIDASIVLPLCWY